MLVKHIANSLVQPGKSHCTPHVAQRGIHHAMLHTQYMHACTRREVLEEEARLAREELRQLQRGTRDVHHALNLTLLSFSPCKVHQHPRC
jgi:hypothetical protein